MADKSRSETIEDKRRLASGFATLGPHASTPLAACPKLLHLSTNRNKTKFRVFHRKVKFGFSCVTDVEKWIN
jgi:hypothetical protein